MAALPEGDARMAARPNMKPPKGWHSRGYLPHFDGGSIPQLEVLYLERSQPAAGQKWRILVSGLLRPFHSG